MKKVYIESTGCAVVRHDTQRYSKYFRLNGWEELNSPKDANLVLITTCGVIKNIEDYTISSVERLKNEMKKGAQLVVGGCLPNINPERLSTVFDGRSFGRHNEKSLDEIVNAEISIDDVFWDGDIIKEHSLGDPELKYSEAELEQLKIVTLLSKKFDNPNFIEAYNYLTKGRFFWEERDLFEVKVSSGCVYKCSYCATKNAIGDLKSRDPEKILKEFSFGVRKGYPKILLTGDEVGEYGKDRGMTLVDLLNILLPESENSRIALRYVSPESLIRQYDELKPFFESGKIYYLCSSFQSGSSRILKLMKRPQNIDELRAVIADINEKFSKVYKHTQMIVGFPQETEEDFLMSLDVIQKSGFEYTSVIKYSDRPNTKSILLDGHITPEIIDERYDRAKNFVSRIREMKLYKKIMTELAKEAQKQSL